jgi:sodium transport system permease protein
MRRSIIRLIARRELRDLLRDRRTLFIVVVLPALLYPVFGLVGVLFAMTMIDQKVVVGVAGIENQPHVPLHAAAFLAGGLLQVECERRFDYPPLIVGDRVVPEYIHSQTELDNVAIVPVPADDDSALREHRIDVLIIIPPGFAEQIDKGERPKLSILGRDGDENSKLAVRRMGGIVNRWQKKLKDVRFARRGLPPDFDEPINVYDPQEAKEVIHKTADELRDMLVKFFPFLLVMWTMAGALHPAIDLTAGEKERGTMETLLISPAERSEIVSGKFLAVWLFSYVSALCNLFWMGGAALALSLLLPNPIISLGGLAWASLFAVPLAALFSAVAIGLGVFARSSKEGQYYLVPLFLTVMPLCLWSMTPGLKFTLGISFVPITGLTLMLQRFMAVSAEPVPISCCIGVFISLVLCVTLSLWWAASQFHRESVLFREAERLSLKGWLRTLIARK